MADDIAWEAFFARNYRSLLTAGVLWGRSLEDAEDAVHLAMIYIRKHWKRIRHPATYAHRIVINYVTATQKRRRDEIVRLIRSGTYTTEYYDDGALSSPHDEAWVRELLRRLPPAQRAAMAGIYDGFSPTEIAAQPGKDPAAVGKNLQLTRECLITELSRQRDCDDEQVAAMVPASVRGKGTR
jgi:DNA-directed RNA polymerase specialized sigma24 family protein